MSSLAQDAEAFDSKRVTRVKCERSLETFMSEEVRRNLESCLYMLTHVTRGTVL